MRTVWLGLWLAALAACGGGGGGGGEAPTPTAPQSVGGIWHAPAPQGSAVTLFIAESGELRVFESSFSFGSGEVRVASGNRVSGTYRTRAIQPDPTVPPAPNRVCEIGGTVFERQVLDVTLTCTDDTGQTTERTFSMRYDASYENDSSLAEIAGNYTLAFNPQDNILNINGDGVIFGMFRNGPACTINGLVELIDPQYSLYRFAFEFSSCQGALGTRYEGVTMRGLGFRNPPGVTPQGGFLLLISAVIDDELEFFSIVYEPV